MIFSSVFFLCIFLPVTLILYYLVPWKFKNFLLLLCSLVFYAWGEPVYVFLMLFSIVFNYLAGLQMAGLPGQRSSAAANSIAGKGKGAVTGGAGPASPANAGKAPASPANAGKAPASPVNAGAGPASPANAGKAPASPANAGKAPADASALQKLSRKRRHIFIFTVVVDVLILCFFKYYGFLITNINSLLGTAIPIRNLALPIGISFYTFQILSYVIDVYWEKVPVQKNIISFGTYITMFPQLIAGPIVRYEDIERQLKRRRLTLAQVSDGAAWFIRGLAKKVLLANNIGLLYDAVFAIPAAQRPVLSAWLGIIAYTFQIYFDFGGYSDMAIGLGKMMGFSFVKNFDYPYISRSVTEFWRRWHISLGTWFREYVYIPMGGNRVSAAKHIRNILVVWLLTGFWHGAAWNFVLWGLYYGLWLLIEKYLLKKILQRLPAALQHLYTILLFVFGWLIFTAPSMPVLGQNFAAMFGALGNSFTDSTTGYFVTTNLVLLFACILGSTPLVWKVMTRLSHTRTVIGKVIPVLCYALMLGASFASLVNATYNPFLYFKF